MNVINRIIRPLGFVIKRSEPEDLLKQKTMYGAIQRSKKFHNIDPATAIDVGAAEGKWTLMALNEWSKSEYVLFEPLKERENVLFDLERKHKNIHFISKAAGNDTQEIDFYVTPD